MLKLGNFYPPIYYFLFKTPLGWCGVVDSTKGVLRVEIGYPGREPLLKKIVNRFGNRQVNDGVRRDLVNGITRYFSGEKVLFNCAMDWSSLSPFQRKVFKEAMKVPYGTAVAYGNLACRIGCPNGSQAVGGALSKNPFPLLIPCHRIIRGDRKLGGFSAPGGIALKRKLLRLEGVIPSLKEHRVKIVRRK